MAQDGAGNDDGAWHSYPILARPSAVTDPASSIGGSTGTLNGTVNPNGDSTTVFFDYGTTTGYGTSLDDGSVGSGTEAVSVSHVVDTLECGTLYHFRVRAENSAGTTHGEDRTFSTTECQNRPPNTPSNPSPADGATWAATSLTLTWDGGDPDAGDTVTYDVFIEANDSTPDNLVCNDVGVTSCSPGSIVADRTYYWYVTARDSYGATATGSTWHFTSTPAPIFADGFESGDASLWSAQVPEP